MKVLLAEDDPMSRRMLQAHLERWGHEVIPANDGAEAWRLFAADHFSLVVTDWMMPEMDGPELIRRIRAAPCPYYVYIILLTAKTSKDDVVRGMEAGADDFIGKPFDREELRTRVRAGERILNLEHNLADQNRALRESQAALVQAEKLASLGRLAAGVAHEINNPIAYVANNLTVLRRETEAALTVLSHYQRGRESLARQEPALAAEIARLEAEADLAYFQETFARTCDKTREGLQRVRDIVRNLRDFARLDEAEVKEISVNDAIASTLEVLSHEAESQKVRLISDCAPIPPITCFAGRINQVFLNLVTNAIQACSAGGTVTVRTRPGVHDGVTVEVVDTGSGIAPEHRARLFEPFFTTKPVGQGTGLGLSVSYGIIRDHGGTIEVDSELGHGTIFRVRLPSHPPGDKLSLHEDRR